VLVSRIPRVLLKRVEDRLKTQDDVRMSFSGRIVARKGGGAVAGPGL